MQPICSSNEGRMRDGALGGLGGCRLRSRRVPLINRCVIYKMAKKKVVFTILLLFSCTWFVVFAVQMNIITICWPCFKSDAEILLTFGPVNGTFSLLPDARCKQKPPFLLILVTTTHDQVEARAAIRKTWGKQQMIGDKRIAVYFLLGTMEIWDSKAEANIAAENLVYRDLIQKNFTDTYYNLTLKTVIGLQWAYNFCPQSQFVMKTDTDMFINVFYLTELLAKKNRTSKFFTGFLKLHDWPIRFWFNKWYVSEKEYPNKQFPPFCSGSGYIFSADVAHDVFSISQNIPLFKLEDVFVGMCLEKMGIRPESLHSEQTFFPIKIAFSVCKFRKIVTCHNVQPSELLIYWNALERSVDEKC